MSGTPLTLRKTVVPVSFGIEIEGRNIYIKRNFLHQHKSFFFFTTDGSLDFTDSVEMVSQPLPPKMLIRVLETFRKKYGDLEQERNGGVHIHITRTKETQKRLTELALMCCETFPWYNPISFFGRTYTHYCYPYHPNTLERYSVVNFRNEKTIEVRAFGNNNPLYYGISSGIAYIKRLQYLLESKEKITPEFLNKIAIKFPIQR